MLVSNTVALDIADNLSAENDTIIWINVCFSGDMLGVHIEEQWQKYKFIFLSFFSVVSIFRSSSSTAALCFQYRMPIIWISSESSQVYHDSIISPCSSKVFIKSTKQAYISMFMSHVSPTTRKQNSHCLAKSYESYSMSLPPPLRVIYMLNCFKKHLNKWLIKHATLSVTTYLIFSFFGQCNKGRS